MYKLIKNPQGVDSAVNFEKDGIQYSIPFNPDNTDYQKYLEWVAEGNTPEPADE
jgi:hypothetical protein